MDFSEMRLLSYEEIYDYDKRIMGFDGYSDSKRAATTDFGILLGGCVYSEHYASNDNTIKGRTNWWWTQNFDRYDEVRVVTSNGNTSSASGSKRCGGIRPAMPIPEHISLPVIGSFNGLDLVRYGEYPQYAADDAMQDELEHQYRQNNLIKTGKTYITDSRKWNDSDADFLTRRHVEYQYKGKKYVRVEYIDTEECTLSNEIRYEPGSYVWVEVQPLSWIVDRTSGIMLSEKIIASGVRMCDGKNNNKLAEMNRFLNDYFARDIVPSNGITDNMTPEEKAEYEAKQKEYERRRNPYGLNFDKVSEEDIIRGSIESGVAVFLHGQSSEGKSARVKQIDPTCVIIYLRNASPESLNGKSVYNQATGEMIDVKPTWLRKLEEKCEQEPDRLHIVFFDEITNALPSIQGIAFNIVLDREVNGIWKLPENARIVAAGNDMQDSLAANQLAEPLFNRFAHVYIKTTTENWLKWAAEHHIHPAIYSYIAYKHGEVLRSKFDGEKPNADPRKWEMASKVLYATGNP